MAITEDDVRKLAQLARLKVSDDQTYRLAPELNEIVKFVEKISELDTDGVEPMSHAIESDNRMRPDELHESLSRDVSLANSPHHDDQYFLVPPVFGPGKE